MPKVVRSRSSGHSRISSKKIGGKYAIKARAPMKPVRLSMPGKVAQAKLDYDIAVEETIQSGISRDIQSLDQQMTNERNRYQVTTRKYVKGEGQMIGSSQNYSMLKRQKETLQREQQRSDDRLSTMKTNKIVSVSPVKSASKSFRGIANINPMQSGKSYVPVIPGSSVTGQGPLGNLDSTFKNVLGSAKNLVPTSFSMLPNAYGASPAPLSTLLKGGKIAGNTFTQSRKRGQNWMEGRFDVEGAPVANTPQGKVVLAEKEKAQINAVKNATPQQIKKMKQSLRKQFPGTGAISTKEAREQIGIAAGKKAETKTLLLLGEEYQNKIQASGYNLNIDPDKLIPASKTAFFDPQTKSGKVGDLIAPMTPAESASHERQIAEDLALRSKEQSEIPVNYGGSNKAQKIGVSGAQGFDEGYGVAAGNVVRKKFGYKNRNVSAAAWFDETTAKKMIAAGTVLGSGTFLPLHSAYADFGPPKAKGFDPVGGVVEFGGDFYKGVKGMFGTKSKRVIKRRPSKKKGKKR
jgi:hypothetical protein